MLKYDFWKDDYSYIDLEYSMTEWIDTKCKLVPELSNWLIKNNIEYKYVYRKTDLSDKLRVYFNPASGQTLSKFIDMDPITAQVLPDYKPCGLLIIDDEQMMLFKLKYM